MACKIGLPFLRLHSNPTPDANRGAAAVKNLAAYWTTQSIVPGILHMTCPYKSFQPFGCLGPIIFLTVQPIYLMHMEFFVCFGSACWQRVGIEITGFFKIGNSSDSE